jgi:hypothetical protein
MHWYWIDQDPDPQKSIEPDYKKNTEPKNTAPILTNTKNGNNGDLQQGLEATCLPHSCTGGNRLWTMETIANKDQMLNIAYLVRNWYRKFVPISSTSKFSHVKYSTVRYILSQGFQDFLLGSFFFTSTGYLNIMPS